MPIYSLLNRRKKLHLKAILEQSYSKIKNFDYFSNFLEYPNNQSVAPFLKAIKNNLVT